MSGETETGRERFRRLAAPAAAYVGGSLLILELWSYISTMWDLPAGLGQALFIGLAAGFVTALAIVWLRTDSPILPAPVLFGIGALSLVIAGLIGFGRPTTGGGGGNATSGPAEPTPVQSERASAVDRKVDELQRRFGVESEVSPVPGARTPSLLFEFNEQPIRAQYIGTDQRRSAFIRLVMGVSTEVGRTERVPGTGGRTEGRFAIPTECGDVPYRVEFIIRQGVATVRATLDETGLRTVLDRTMVDGDCF